MKLTWENLKKMLRILFNGVVLLLTASVIFASTKSVMAQPVAHATAFMLWF